MSWINAVSSHIYRTLRLISSVFQNFHTMEEHFCITVTSKHHLDAEMKKSPSAPVFERRMRNMLTDSVWCCIPVCILKLAVINEWYKSLSSCFKAGTFIHSHEVTSVACIKPSMTTDVRSFLLWNHNCFKMSAWHYPQTTSDTCISPCHPVKAWDFEGSAVQTVRKYFCDLAHFTRRSLLTSSLSASSKNWCWWLLTVVGEFCCFPNVPVLSELLVFLTTWVLTAP